MAAAIDHPNVIPVYAAGEYDGFLYLVMRYVGGTDLHGCCASEGALEPERAAELVAQVAAALDAAHAAGLVHRDVKPANVLLAGDHAYLSDFGLTRLAGSDTQLTAVRPVDRHGRLLLARAAARRARPTRAPTSTRSGCVLYAALTGGPPFAHGTVPATMLAHLHDPPPMPSERGAPREFDRVIARALAKDPAERYPSAGDLGRAALAAARGEPVTESERSVAVGSAAPSDHGAVNGDATARTPAERTDRDATGVTSWDPGSHGEEPATAWDPAAHRDEPTAFDGGRRRDPAGDRRRAARPATAASSARAAGPPARRWRSRRFLAARRARPPSPARLFDDPGGGRRGDRPADRERGPRRRAGVRGRVRRRGPGGAAQDARPRRHPHAPRRHQPGAARRSSTSTRASSTARSAATTSATSRSPAAAPGVRAATYKVDRDGGDPYEGSIVFGVIRERGEPRIQLIAAEPRS